MSRLLTRVLRLLADAELAESVLGDLREEERRRFGRAGGRHDLWFTRELAAVCLRTLMWRIADAVGRFRVIGQAMTGLRAELGHSVRALRRSPVFSIASIGVLGVGISLLAMIFSLVDGVLFRPLPFPASQELVSVEPGHEGLDKKFGRPRASVRDVRDWAAAVPEVQFSGFQLGGKVDLQQTVNAPQVEVAAVDAEFLSVLRVRPAIGGFETAHFRKAADGAPTPAMISFGLWRTQFGADPNVVGTRVDISRVRHVSFQIVGVLPEAFVFPADVEPQVLTPFIQAPDLDANPRRRVFTGVVARVPPGLTAGVLHTRLEAAMRGTARAFPGPEIGQHSPRSDAYRRFAGPFDTADIQPLTNYMHRSRRGFSAALVAGALLFGLLIAINISGLLVARWHGRQQELTTRRALGADAWGIARLVVVEVVVVVLAGTALGLGALAPLIRLVQGLLPDGIFQGSPAVDWRVAAFVVLASGVLAAAVSVWPIRRAVVASRLTDADAGRASTSRTRSFSSAVICAEVGLGFALTLIGTMLVAGLGRLWQEDVGFDGAQTVALTTRLDKAATHGGDLTLRSALDRLRAMPGVEAAGATDALVLQHASLGGVFVPPAGAANPELFVDSHGVTPGFFDVLRPRLVRGRYPTPDELERGNAVVVGVGVAAAYWPDRDPIGQQIYTADRGFTVVGVVPDARYSALDGEPRWIIYGPYAELALSSEPTILVRVSSEATGIERQLVERLAGMKPALVVRQVKTISELLAESITQRRFQSLVFGTAAGAALGVLGVGVFALLALTTVRRTREIGIRMALGAARPAVTLFLLREHCVAVGWGLVVGASVSIPCVNLIRAYVYRFSPHDVRPWIATVVVVLASAALGAVIPALRASRTDPVQTLRAN